MTTRPASHGLGPAGLVGRSPCAIVDWLRQPTPRVVLHRLAMSVPLLFVVTALSFVLASLTPGDPTLQILGPEAPAEAREALRTQLGLDQPVYEQYWQWLSGAVSGDLGTSIYSSQSVVDAINERLPATLSLIVISLLVTAGVGIGLGVLSAARGGVPSRVLDALLLVGFAVPAFWAGAVLIALFAVQLRWFPATGYVPLAESPGRWASALILPVTALALHGVAVVAKQTREAMSDVLASEYIRIIRANGIGWGSIIFRHALKNAAIRVTTVLGLQAVVLLGGTVVVESVFALPGLGFRIVDATTRHDLPVVQGIVVYLTIFVIAINLIVDLSYVWLNPKVRVS